MDRRAFLSAAACSIVSASAQIAQAQPTRRFAPAIRYNAEHDGASFIVVRHGIVLAESYPRGAPETRWPIGAGARALAGLLAATMVEDRLMSLDEPVAMTLGDWGAHPVKMAITIRQLLAGVSGVAFGDAQSRTLFDAIALEPRDTPGVRFIDDPAPYVLFAEIARRKLVNAGREPDPARYFTDRALTPIGAVPVGWARMPDGTARFDDGVALSARGWAQAGELIRREGVWRAQQIADDGALRDAVRGSLAEARAGFGLWIAMPGARNSGPYADTDLWREPSPAPIDLAMAAGAGGQRLYIAPSVGVVIVRQSTSATSADWSDAHFLSLLWPDL